MSLRPRLLCYYRYVHSDKIFYGHFFQQIGPDCRNVEWKIWFDEDENTVKAVCGCRSLPCFLLTLSVLRWSSLMSARCPSFMTWAPKDCERLLLFYWFSLHFYQCSVWDSNSGRGKEKTGVGASSRSSLFVSVLQGGHDLQALRRTPYPWDELLWSG